MKASTKLHIFNWLILLPVITGMGCAKQIKSLVSVKPDLITVKSELVSAKSDAVDATASNHVTGDAIRHGSTTQALTAVNQTDQSLVSLSKHLNTAVTTTDHASQTSDQQQKEFDAVNLKLTDTQHDLDAQMKSFWSHRQKVLAGWIIGLFVTYWVVAIGLKFVSGMGGGILYSLAGKVAGGMLNVPTLATAWVHQKIDAKAATAKAGE